VKFVGLPLLVGGMYVLSPVRHFFFVFSGVAFSPAFRTSAAFFNHDNTALFFYKKYSKKRAFATRYCSPHASSHLPAFERQSSDKYQS
jgi:hypothetical protein